MSFLTNAQNTSIHGATFNAVVHGNVHHHSQLSIARRKQKGFEILQHHVAQGAFHDSFERSDPPRCHPRTRRAILEKITDWILDPDNLELFLWIFGPAGGGKTAIAQTIAEMFAAAGSLTASCFFSRTVAGRKDFNHLVPTLAYQFALHIPEVREDVSLAIERDPAVFSRALAAQIQILIIQPLNAAAEDPLQKETMEKRKNVVVLDGLDECGDERSQREVLEVLSTNLKLLTVPVRFLITSRPEQQIRVAFSKPELKSQTLTIALDETFNPDDDIRGFLEAEFWNLKMNHPSRSQLPDQWPSEDDICHIVRKSSGQFIYPATVMKFMDSHRHSPIKRLKIILGATAPSSKDSPYAELDALYQQLFLAIDDLDGALDLLTLLVLQDIDSYYLTVDFSENLLGYDKGDVLTMLSDMHAFVHVPKPDNPYDAIRIHHASLPDFLFDPSRSERFFIDSRNGHANVTTHWLKFVQRRPLPHFGAHTVVCPRGHDSIIITVERIIEHCTQSHLTDELCEALSTFNLEAHLILYPGSAFKELIQSISSFLRWLKPEPPELGDAKWKLYHYHMRHIDHWILSQLSSFPDEMKPCLPAAFIFEDQFSSSPGALFDILSHKFDSSENSFSKIEYSNTNKAFWFICQEFGGRVLFDLFKKFFTDSSRSKTFFVDAMQYAELACVFLDYIRLVPEGRDIAEPWSYSKYQYIPNGNRYRMTRTEGADEVLIRAALEFLPSILSRSSQNEDLVQGLNDHALQLRTADPLHEKRLEAALASFEYLKKVDFVFQGHSHKADYDVCIVCLLQPNAIPAPVSRSSSYPVAVPQQVEATSELVNFIGQSEQYPRWIPHTWEDSELDETVIPGGILQLDDDPQQLAAEQAILSELHSKWIRPMPKDLELKKTVTPYGIFQPGDDLMKGTTPFELLPRLILPTQEDSEFDKTVIPKSSPHRAVYSKLVEGVTAELVTSTEPHPMSILPMLGKDSDFDETAIPNQKLQPNVETVIPNAFSKSLPHPAVNPKPVVEIAAETSAELHPRLILPTRDDLKLKETAIPNTFSKSPPHQAGDLKPVVEVAAETSTELHPRLSLPTREDSEFDKTLIPKTSPHRGVDSKLVAEVATEPVTSPEPYPRSILPTREDSELDETAIPNGKLQQGNEKRKLSKAGIFGWLKRRTKKK